MITNVEIHNFKSIRDVSVELSPVTVLIGKSGVGKSNFLRAIRFLRNYLLAGETAVQAEGGWTGIFPFGSKEKVSFRIHFNIPGYEEPFRYEIGWAPHPHAVAAYPSEERLHIADKMIFGWSQKSWETWPDSRPQPQLLPGHANVHLGSFPTISEAVLAFSFLTNGLGWHDFPSDVFRLPEVGNGLFGANNASIATRGLFDNGGNYLDVLRDLTQNLQSQHARRQIVVRIKQINPSVSSLELDSILKPQKVIVTHRVGDQLIPLELSQESDGFRRYYAHLLALYQTPPKQVLMFEEPENGIYPGALQNLAEEFQEAADGGRGQVVLTTHNPALLDGFKPESIRVVDVDETQATRIGALDPSQSQAIRDRLMEPGELMTVDQARMATTS